MIFKATKQTVQTYLYPEDMELKSFKNAMLSEGKIVQGPAFIEGQTPAIRLDNSTGSEMRFEITSCKLFYRGKQGVIAQSISDNLFGNITHDIIFVAEDGETLPLGSISFRTNGADFSYPSFLFFSGRKTVGEGIYFISRQVYDEGEDFIVLREYSAKDNMWVILSDTEIYAPTIFKYGRGEAYQMVLIGGNPLDFPTPRGDEPRNLLSDGFVSQFTTDGLSYGFTLPLSRLDDELIKATLKLSGKEHTFSIFSGSIQSDPVMVGEEEITMYCDRSYGRVFFEKKGEGSWSVPFSNEYNNLSVLAHKRVEGHRARVSAMTSAKKLSGSVITGGEAVTVFWGSEISPSSIIVNSPKHPLYFPTTGEYVLGEEREIEEVLTVGKNLFVFKGNEVYKSELRPSGEETSYPLSFTLYLELPTTLLKNTVATVGGQIFFCDKAGNVYKITGGSIPFAERIYIGKTTFDFAAAGEDKYLLIKDSFALVLQKNGESLAACEWTLPRRCLGVFSHTEPLFFFERITGSFYDILSAKIGEGTNEGSAEILVPLLKDKGENRLVALTLYGEKGDFTLKCENVARRGRLKEKGERLLIGGVYENPMIRLCFKGGFSLQKIKTEYIKKG